MQAKRLAASISLFEGVNSLPCETGDWRDRQGCQYEYRYACQVPFNDTHVDREVNFVEVRETSPAGKTQHFSWTTDRPVSHGSVESVMRGGRIENATFSTGMPATLKNQSYHFEHNFGHGYGQLCTVFLRLMWPAFRRLAFLVIRPVPLAISISNA